MSTVNDFTDILRIIREQPEWGDALRSALLSKDLLEMPQRLAEFAAAAERRFAALEGDVVELKAGQARLEGDVVELKAGQARLEGDVVELKAGQARLEGDVAELKAGQARLEEGQSKLEAGQNRLEGQVGNLRGAAYEQKVANNIGTYVRHPLGLRRVRLLKGYGAIDPAAFHELMDAAEDSGAISERERVETGSSDMVLRGQRLPDHTGVYVALEVSVTVADSDIALAVERAEILQRATGEPTFAAVVGSNADRTRRRFAQERDVTLISVAE